MKKPYLDRLDRIIIQQGSAYGDLCMLDFRIQQLKMAIYRTLFGRSQKNTKNILQNPCK